MAAPHIVRTQKQAAAALGVTDRQFRTWLGEAWFPPGGKTAAGYNVQVIRAARDAIGRKGSETSDTAKKLKLATDGEKLKQAQLVTRQKELELRQTEGDLIQRRAVELHFATLLTALGDWCDQLPELLAGELPRKHAPRLKARLKQELDRRRREVKNELERQAREWAES